MVPSSCKYFYCDITRIFIIHFKPPPGFEAVLAPTVYQQLIAVHQNTKLSVVEKKQQVDKVMQQVPADQLAK